MHESGSDDAGSEPAVCDPDAAHGALGSRQGTVVERLSRYGMRVMPGAFQRGSRLQRQMEVSASRAPLHRESTERTSLTPALRKKYLKELILGNCSSSSPSSSHGGFSSVRSSLISTESSEQDAAWALYPMEHAWTLCAVEANYDTILEFISEEPCLLTRRDFISGYSVLHWLAKRGQDETLLRVLRYAESAGIRADVNARGSGGLTPLHVASMHRQYAVIKLLVGAFGADVDAMDHNGRRAWQYLGGDAPPEMKELLGTWDEEHRRCGAAQNVNNNNCACAATAGEQEERDEGQRDEVRESFQRTERTGSWRFKSFRKMLPSFSFKGHK